MSRTLVPAVLGLMLAATLSDAPASGAAAAQEQVTFRGGVDLVTATVAVRDRNGRVVRDRATGEPIAHMKFYGEFRWHKRSEEYYVLDITHPDAEAYIRKVFRTWRREWGAGYFKTDFMLFGSEYGPDRAVWHVRILERA